MLDLLIDLDNTVYPESSEIFSQIDKKMKEFISKNLSVNIEEAFIIQKKYFKEEGTTLRGLMLHHNIKPAPFLKYVHDINLASINKNLELKKFLKNYPGKKIIFTNGTKEHAVNVLSKVSILESIDSIFDIVNANYIPKPNSISYEKVITKYSLKPKNTVMFDDIPVNLKTANKIGIKTVLIKKELEKNRTFDYIDIVSDDLLKGLYQINKGNGDENKTIRRKNK